MFGTLYSLSVQRISYIVAKRTAINIMKINIFYLKRFIIFLPGRKLHHMFIDRRK